MARIFVTGSTDGVGLNTARALIAGGHEVVAHARNSRRAAQTAAGLEGSATTLIGDLASFAETIALAAAANEIGTFDAIIHNAGIGSDEPRLPTVDGCEHVLQINAIAAYILTALIHPPKRLIYVTSGQHLRGTPNVSDIDWMSREWDPLQAYADSKLYESTIAFAVARMWPHVIVNTCEPGWVPTKMAHYDAPDDLSLGHLTQVWLATSFDRDATTSGGYYYHRQPQEANPVARSISFQEEVLGAFERITSLRL